jgi:uncharacterized protein
MERQAGPVAATERIQSIDIVRGAALLGIYIMNLPTFNGSIFGAAVGAERPTRWYDRAVDLGRDALCAGKFNGMFSLLFAVGFTLQLERLEASGRRALYLRRLVVLLAIGLIHGCIFWEGDVLHVYAFLGLGLFVLRRASTRTVIVLLVASLFYTPALSVWRMLTFTPAQLQRMVAETSARVASNNQAFGHGTFWAAAAEHRRTLFFFYSRDWIVAEIGFMVQMWTTMMLGLLAARHRLFQTVRARLPLIRKVQWWSLALGLLFGALFALTRALNTHRLQPSLLSLAGGVAFVWSRPFVMSFYVMTLLRLAEHPLWQRRLRPIALAGRMPLTNYLLETALASLLFYGWGLGLWGKLGAAQLLALTLALYAGVLVPFSVLWMRRFPFGPLEYVWRALTYGRWPGAPREPPVAPPV